MVYPASASATFGLQDPATPEPTRKLIHGGIKLAPEPPAIGASLLSRCDPWANEALPFFAHAINERLGLAYQRAMAGQALVDSNKACVETAYCDPGPYLGAQSLRLPLLAIFPVRGKAAEMTLARERADTTYRVVYLLPALTWEQGKRIYPLLHAVAHLLHLCTEEGGLDTYQSGRRVWDEANTTEVSFEGWEIGPVAGDDSFKAHLAMQAEMRVRLHDRWDASTARPLWRYDLTTTSGDNPDAQIDPFIEARVQAST